MGLFSKPVTDKELRDFRRGRPVRAAVAEQAVLRNGTTKAAKAAIRAQARRNARITRQDLDLL